METSLLDLYDNLKHSSAPAAGPAPIQLRMNPIQVGKFHHKCGMNQAMLKEKCGKHILLDIYCKILPLDQDYVDTHQGQMSADVSAMLKQKGMTPTEYLTSAYEKTKAPMLEYVLNCIKTIGECYIKEAEDQLEDAMNGEAPENPPDPPSTEEEPVQSQLVDLKNDMEYQQFIDILKKKTVDKIVNDVSELINSKKEENDMEFNTSGGQDNFGSLDNNEGSEENKSEEGSSDEGTELPPVPNEDFSASESAVAVGLEYLSKKLWQYEFTQPGKDEALGMAIREATLYQIDKVFRQKTFQEFASGVYFGQGYIINESAVTAFLEKLAPGQLSDILTTVNTAKTIGKRTSDDVYHLLKKTDEKIDKISKDIDDIKEKLGKDKE